MEYSIMVMWNGRMQEAIRNGNHWIIIIMMMLDTTTTSRTSRNIGSHFDNLNRVVVVVVGSSIRMMRWMKFQIGWNTPR